MFRGINAIGFGDYADGFYPENANNIGSKSLPGCEVEDDYYHLLGDENEGMLSAALYYKDTGICPEPPSLSNRPVIQNTDPTLDLMNDERLKTKDLLNKMLLINN